MLTVVLFLVPLHLKGQQLSNVDFYVEGSSIIVTYNINDCKGGCNVALRMKSKDGKIIVANNITGDVQSISDGNSKSIKWNPLLEDIDLKGDFMAVLTISRSSKHYVGDRLFGGIVYWVDEYGKHGLVADSSDLGKMNWEKAMSLCDERGEGWRLPTKKELNKLFSAKFKVDFLTADYYWSSTEDNVSYSWGIRLNDGVTSRYDKLFSFYVRAVRSF
jgi:hypothetical protein